MSLKAKLEAVIYAAEEPVTLAQLAALFTADALEFMAEQAAASAKQAAEADQPLSATNEEFDYFEADQITHISDSPEAAIVSEEPAPKPVPEISTEPDQPPQAEASVDADSSPTLETAPETSIAEDSEPALAPEAAVDSESELRRQARQRDREVRAVIRQLVDELIAFYASDNRGVEIREIAGGYRMATKPECHDAVRAFVKSLKPALKLSLPALETLAVVAYKQPVTAPEVNEIRGVDSSGVFGSLLARKLIATAGRKQVIGRPILYKTTREFLLRFGLKDVSELPSMEEFEKMAAIELDEPELASEGEAKPNQDPSLEFDETASDQSTERPDPGAAPESAESPTPMPVETTAQNPAETPAVMAADPSTAPDESGEAVTPEADPAPQPNPADEPAANEPANQAESTPA